MFHIYAILLFKITDEVEKGMLNQHFNEKRGINENSSSPHLPISFLFSFQKMQLAHFKGTAFWVGLFKKKKKVGSNRSLGQIYRFLIFIGNWLAESTITIHRVLVQNVLDRRRSTPWSKITEHRNNRSYFLIKREQTGPVKINSAQNPFSCISGAPTGGFGD